MNDLALSYITTLRSDPYPNPAYEVCNEDIDLLSYIKYFSPSANFDIPAVACDTESLPDGTPYCLTLSVSPGTGCLIYVKDKTTMELFGSWLDDGPNIVVFHNYLHDIEQFDRLGLKLTRNNFADTMLIAYELCLGGGGDEDETGMAGRGSLGLKQLAYRYLNMTMTSFKDTVFPHSMPHLVEYLKTVAQITQPMSDTKYCECGHRRDLHQPKGKTFGPCTLCQCPKAKLAKITKSEEDTLINRLHLKTKKLITDINNHLHREPIPDFNPWSRINDWNPWDHDFLSELTGPVPTPSIADVPEPYLLPYACRDADATLRLYHYLNSNLSPWLFFQD